MKYNPTQPISQAQGFPSHATDCTFITSDCASEEQPPQSESSLARGGLSTALVMDVACKRELV